MQAALGMQGLAMLGTWMVRRQFTPQPVDSLGPWGLDAADAVFDVFRMDHGPGVGHRHSGHGLAVCVDGQNWKTRPDATPI